MGVRGRLVGARARFNSTVELIIESSFVQKKLSNPERGEEGVGFSATKNGHTVSAGCPFFVAGVF